LQTIAHLRQPFPTKKLLPKHARLYMDLLGKCVFIGVHPWLKIRPKIIWRKFVKFTAKAFGVRVKISNSNGFTIKATFATFLRA
jgi:hypothetical protein